MGSGASTEGAHRLKESAGDHADDDQIYHTYIRLYADTRFNEKDDWIPSIVELTNGAIEISDVKTDDKIVTIDLTEQLVLSLETQTDFSAVIVTYEESKNIHIKATNGEEEALHWLRMMRREIMLISREENFSTKMLKLTDQFHEFNQSGKIDVSKEIVHKNILYDFIPVPKLNVVILVVGTRGDVQPFIYFGQELQKYGIV